MSSILSTTSRPGHGVWAARPPTGRPIFLGTPTPTACAVTQAWPLREQPRMDAPLMDGRVAPATGDQPPIDRDGEGVGDHEREREAAPEQEVIEASRYWYAVTERCGALSVAGGADRRHDQSPGRRALARDAGRGRPTGAVVRRAVDERGAAGGALDGRAAGDHARADRAAGGQRTLDGARIGEARRADREGLGDVEPCPHTAEAGGVARGRHPPKGALADVRAGERVRRHERRGDRVASDLRAADCAGAEGGAIDRPGSHRGMPDGARPQLVAVTLSDRSALVPTLPAGAAR